MDGKRAALSVAFALAIACSPTAGTGTATGSATPAATLGGTSGRPATAQPTAGGTTTQAQLNEVLAAARLSPYKITYRYTLAGLVSEQSWYSKPPRQRFDFSTGAGAQAFVISYFTLPEGSFYCFTAGTTKQCMAIQGVGSPLEQNPAAMFVQSMVQNPGSYAGTFVERKTFAGQEGLCYDVNGTVAGPTSGRFCYTQTGILLYSAFGAAGTQVVMEATNVSTTVPDSDFDLPAKP